MPISYNTIKGTAIKSMVKRVASGVTMADRINAARIACFRYLANMLADTTPDPRQDGERQRQFERTAEYQEKFDVEVDVGTDAQLRRDIVIHAEADEEIDDQRENDELQKINPKTKSAPASA